MELPVTARRAITGQHFPRIRVMDKGFTLEDCELIDCETPGVTIVPANPVDWNDARPSLTDVRFTRCRITQGSCDLVGCMLDTVSFDSVSSRELWLLMCSLSHVRFSGYVRFLWLDPARDTIPGDWTRIVMENAAVHRATDWAVDISQADFGDVTIRGLPPDKIRVDPARQAIVTAESLTSSGEAIPAELLVGTPGYVISQILGQGPYPCRDLLIWAKRDSKTFSQEIDLVRYLHAEHLAMPAWPGE